MSEGHTASVKLFRGSFFYLYYPSRFECEIIEDIPSFYHLNEDGVLQVASFRQAGGSLNLEEEMTRYLAKHNIRYDRNSVTFYKTEQGVESIVCEFVAKDRFWLVNIAGTADVLLMVLYHAESIPDSERAQEVSAVIRSITFIDHGEWS